MFHGTQVDGINFETIDFDLIPVYTGRQSAFNRWLKSALNYRADSMMDEYIRLTNIAFAIPSTVDCFKTPPVFLLDEVQNICTPTTIRSKQNCDSVKMHTLLSFLLTELAGRHRPICICTGTNNGDIIAISEMSAIIPQVLSLTPLVNDYWEYWTEMTAHFNKGRDDPVQMEGDQALIECLVYASYQIPRLLLIAHQTWFINRASGLENREYFIQKFEILAIKYYNELGSLFSQYSVKDISCIILCCAVHWIVRDVQSCVPGTDIQWTTLIQQSIIFPYLDDCYLFPFTLIWRFKTLEVFKEQVESYCSQVVPNLELKHLFISYDNLCKFDIYHLGTFYESMFVSSLAVKYYIRSLSRIAADPMVSFTSLYDFGGAESDDSKSLLEKFRLNLSKGICYPAEVASVNQDTFPNAVIHNKRHHNAHHDIILPTSEGPLPISAKASFTFPAPSTVTQQQSISKASQEESAPLLIWLYLGSYEKEIKQPSVAFLNGSGVCNGLSLDLFILLKKLKSENNQHQ